MEFWRAHWLVLGSVIALAIFGEVSDVEVHHDRDNNHQPRARNERDEKPQDIEFADETFGGEMERVGGCP